MPRWAQVSCEQGMCETCWVGGGSLWKHPLAQPAAQRAGRDTLSLCSLTFCCSTANLPPQVFDVRMTPRMLSSVPFAPGPSLLRFHPRFSSTLLLASASGAFTLADAQGMSRGCMLYFKRFHVLGMGVNVGAGFCSRCRAVVHACGWSSV